MAVKESVTTSIGMYGERREDTEGDIFASQGLCSLHSACLVVAVRLGVREHSPSSLLWKPRVQSGCQGYLVSQQIF